MTNRTNVNNGIATLTVHETLQPGTYTISGHYNGSDHYEESEGEAELEVLKKTSSVTLSSTQTEYDVSESAILNMEVTDGNGNPITSGAYELYQGSTRIQTGIINGNQTALSVSESTAGVKTYKVIYIENETYTGSSSNEIEITFKKKETVTVIDSCHLHSNANSSVIYHVEDSEGNEVKAGKAVAKINGQTVKDSNGKVIYLKLDQNENTFIILKSLNTGSSYQVQVTYAGNDDYGGSKGTATYTATELPTISEINSAEVALMESEFAFAMNITSNAPSRYIDLELQPIFDAKPLYMLTTTPTEDIIYVFGEISDEQKEYVIDSWGLSEGNLIEIPFSEGTFDLNSTNFLASIPIAMDESTFYVGFMFDPDGEITDAELMKGD